MHVKSLKIFCDVVGRRSFSRAAAENGITQSGASQIVHQLEERLGTKLIDRSKRPFVLTRAGELYYDGCRKIVQRFYALEEEVRTLQHDVSGRVNVASIYSVGLSHMNDLLQQFLSQHPKAKVSLQYHHPDRVYQSVESGEFDFGLVSYAKSSRSIEAIPWREETMIAVCAPTHRWADQFAIPLSEFHNEAMVSFDTELLIRRKIDRQMASQRIDPQVVMEFDNIETIKRAIEINAGVGLLPEPTVTREVQAGTLVAVALADQRLTRPLGIIRQRTGNLGKTAERFMQLLRDSDGSSLNEQNQTLPQADSHKVVENSDADRPARTLKTNV